MTNISNRVTELTSLLGDGASMAVSIADSWDSQKNDRREWEDQKLELRKYITAIDTSTTSNKTLPWKNSTTIPKLTQLRDNLHANYMGALFPNDEWLRWEGYNKDDETGKKRAAIQAYMGNKTREGHFRSTMSQLVLDYIDYGIAIADVAFVNENKEDELTGETIPGYVGPKLLRISPHDHVFDGTASSYRKAPKISRYIKSLGELKADLNNQKGDEWILDSLAKAEELRSQASRFGLDDFHKLEGFRVDGFQNMYDYLQSGLVEVLEFEGDFYDSTTGEYFPDHIITILDRRYVARKVPNPSWLHGGTKYMVGWRNRPDNLYGMGPLDNLVGMQYRLDHLENLKADAMDLAVYPPVAVKGDVEDFVWQPMEVVEMGEDGEIGELGKNLQGVIAAQTEMNNLMNLMEEMAGAPKQAMGIRTPGEKTAFEVQSLENAAGRIFQSKVTKFEIELLEPILNAMLEVARRNLEGSDVARVLDNDLGVVDFLTITKEDITARGHVRPIGARHFAARAQLVQNLTGLSNTPIWQQVSQHLSSKQLSVLVEDVMNLGRYELFAPNQGVVEQVETQRLVQEASTQLQEEAITPIE